MSVHKSFKIPESLDEKVEKDMKRLGMTTATEYFTEATKHFLACKTVKGLPTMRMILTEYADKCLLQKAEDCKERRGHIERGERVYHSRGVGVICLSCAVESQSDKSLVALYLKSRRYKKIVKALTTEADELAEKVEAWRGQNKLEDLWHKMDEKETLVIQYLREKLGTPEEQEAFKEMLRRDKIVETALIDLEDYVKNTLLETKWFRRARKKKGEKAIP